MHCRNITLVTQDAYLVNDVVAVVKESGALGCEILFADCETQCGMLRLFVTNVMWLEHL